MRRLPRLAFIPLAFIAVESTYAAIFLIYDRGDDFRRFYASAAAWARGANPYAVFIDDTPNLNHPVLLPLFWLFTRAPQNFAFIAWSICSLLLLIASAIVVSRLARLPPLHVLVAILALTATLVELTFGQVSFVLMPVFTAAWCADRKGRSTEGGALLGALTVLKPFYGAFALLLAWRRQWAGLLAYAAVFAAGTLVGILIVGPSVFLDWVTRLEEVRWRWHLYNASIWGVGDRLFSEQPFVRATAWTPLVHSAFLFRGTVALLGLSTVVVTIRGLSKSDIDRSYALLGLAALLISPLGWLYYVPAFLGPVIVTLSRRPSGWLWPLTIMAVCPYTLLVGRAYGRLGTIIVGQWAFVTVLGLLLLVAAAPELESKTVIQANA